MKVRFFAILLAVLPELLFCQEERRPNIVFILSDDHSAPHLSCYGDPNVSTPHIDAIAGKGIRFTQMYTNSPQCVPSRATLMTGRDSVDIRMTRFSAPLPADVVTFPELLRSAGYHTGIQGRSYHLDGSDRRSPEAAAVFEEFQLRTFHRRVDFLQTGPDEENLAVMQSFLDDVPNGKPFFLWINYSNPHRPYTAPPEFLPAPDSLVLPPDYPDTQHLRKDLAAYYGEIQQLDMRVGLVLQELKNRGLINNTLIIFMGDNGAALLRGKGTLYQTGLRVPLVMCWGDRIKQETVSNDLLSGTDLAPTILDIAGVLPDINMSGRSFKPLLIGGNYTPNDYVFAERGAHADMLPTSTAAFDLSRSVTGKRYKLIYNILPALPYVPVDMSGQAFWKELVALNKAGNLDTSFRRLIFAQPRPMFELFDLEKDPHELDNLYGEEKVAVPQQQLLAALNRWMIRYQDFVPLPIKLVHPRNAPATTPAFPPLTVAQSTLTNVVGRNSISLNGDWQTIVDWYDRGEQRRIYLDEPPKNNNAFNEYSFADETLTVPGDWNSQRATLEYYEGIIWYKKEFNIDTKPGERLFIHFGAANYRTKVYLNGQLLGVHEGGFTPFQFEVTDHANKGLNKLIVKVDNRRISDGIPALNFDWWNYGGITRDVSLIATPASYIADYFIQLKKGSQDTIAGWLRLNGNEGSENIALSLPGANIRHTFRTDAEGYVSFAFHAEVERWSPSNPKLYHIEINSDHDQIGEQIGFRNIDVKGDELLLNGEPIFLKGISIHEEIPQRKSRVSSEADVIQLLLQARELGCNFIRTAHYPQHEYLIRKAEEMGFMVWEEIPIWQGVDFTSPEITGKAQAMLRDMITRDKNRCGVIIWSLSNETRPAPDRNRVLRELASFSRTMDPTRLIASAFDQFKYSGNKIIIDDPLSKDLDLLAANKYMGWYTPWPAGPGNIRWETTYKKPLIISEFGAEALYGNHGTADTASSWTEEYQAKVMEDNIRMFRSNPQLRGVCPWVLADFRSPTRMHGTYQNGWNRKGLLSEHGKKKKAWYVIRDYFAPHSQVPVK